MSFSRESLIRWIGPHMRPIAAAGSVLVILVLNSTASAGQNLIQHGYIHLQSNRGTVSPKGIAIFGLQSHGILVAEGTVPATAPMRSGRVFVEIEPPVNTGIALANPNDQDVSISYNFTDGSGQDFGAGSLTLPAHHQLESFFTEPPFAVSSSLVGTFSFTSSSPVVGVALRSISNQRGDVLKTTLPVSPLGSGFGGTELSIPQLENGGSWTTQIVLVNPGDASLTGTVRFFGPGSKSLSMTPAKVVVDNVTGSSFHYAIPPRGVFRMRPQTMELDAAPGLVRITPSTEDAVPSCLAIFSYTKSGITISTSSIAALPASEAFRMYIESSDVFGRPGSIQSLVTVRNPSDESAVAVRFEVMNLDGTSSGLSTSADIPAGGQMMRLVGNLFPQLPSRFKGIIRITAPSPITLGGLRARYNERGDVLVAATPPFDESTASQTELDFPYFITGAGYSTELILLSMGQAHTGSLWLFSQDGVPLPPSVLQPNP
jgi:hypothetical protein